MPHKTFSSVSTKMFLVFVREHLAMNFLMSDALLINRPKKCWMFLGLFTWLCAMVFNVSFKICKVIHSAVGEIRQQPWTQVILRFSVLQFQLKKTALGMRLIPHRIEWNRKDFCNVTLPLPSVCSLYGWHWYTCCEEVWDRYKLIAFIR